MKGLDYTDQKNLKKDHPADADGVRDLMGANAVATAITASLRLILKRPRCFILQHPSLQHNLYFF